MVLSLACKVEAPTPRAMEARQVHLMAMSPLTERLARYVGSYCTFVKTRARMLRAGGCAG